MHYKDGTPAQINDIVKGKPYNTAYEVVGVVGSLNPLSPDGSCGIYVMFASTSTPWSGGAPTTIILTGDYGGCQDFELVKRAYPPQDAVQHAALFNGDLRERGMIEKETNPVA